GALPGRGCQPEAGASHPLRRVQPKPRGQRPQRLYQLLEEHPRVPHRTGAGLGGHRLLLGSLSACVCFRGARAVQNPGRPARRERHRRPGAARGWADIGYSWGLCPHAYVCEGRGLYKTQAAQPGGNTTYYSVTLMCGPTDTITDVQINAVRQLRAWLMETAGVAGTVKGHRDFISTSCPGDALYRMVRDGVFSKPATWGGTSSWEDMLIGLKKGDKGEAVEALQELIRLAGHGAAL